MEAEVQEDERDWASNPLQVRVNLTVELHFEYVLWDNMGLHVLQVIIKCCQIVKYLRLKLGLVL